MQTYTNKIMHSRLAPFNFELCLLRVAINKNLISMQYVKKKITTDQKHFFFLIFYLQYIQSFF